MRASVLFLGSFMAACSPTPAPAPPEAKLGVFPAAEGALHGAGPGPLSPPFDAARPRSEPDETGRASYYADSLAGNHTASGERYDPTALTAAHRKLPFETVVDVRRVDTGAMVRVRINDRGPFGGRGRIIDLSRRAAESLDMMRAGVVEVEIWLVPGG